VDFIFEDISIVRPTVISATPRLFNVLYSEYQKEMRKLATVPTYIALEKEDELLDRIRSMLGDRIETIITGGAPTSPQVFQFLHTCFPHCNVVNGYGTTEVGTIMSNGAIDPSVDYKLEDVSDMGYKTSDLPFPRGELLVKTNKQFSGYYNNEELNQDAFDKDGYYRTGDIVEIAENETMRVIDRKKNIFKLAQGEFVSPESLENAYIESPLINQIYVYGNTSRSYVVAVVVPKEDWTASLSEEQVRERLIQEMRSIAKRRELRSYEVPRAILLESDQFSPENGKLTGTLKIARFFCERVYKDELEKLYDSLQSQEEQHMRSEIKELMNVDGNNSDPLGIDSLHAVRLVSHLKRKYNVDVPLEFIVKQNTSLNDVTSYVMTHQHEASNATENTEIDWMLESTLDLDYYVPSYETSRQQSVVLDNKKCILLTGCTGFLGSFLLRQLLHVTPETCKIYCLVRANSTEKAQERVINALKSYKLWEEKFITRIVILQGSLSKPNFGLNENTYSELAQQVQVIYHNAANVNHIASYRELKADNVTGTLNLLRFAVTHTAKVFHYISTISVPDDVTTIDDAGGYAQTKYVSEQHIKHAREKGLLATIYRPGMISGDTVHGCCNTSDWVSRLIQCCLAIGFYPDTEDSTISMIPVDVVADIILYLSQQESSLDVPAFRVVSPHHLSFDTLMDDVTDVVPMRKLSFETWYGEVKNRAEEQKGRGKLEAVLALFREGFNSKADEYDEELNQALPTINIPPITAELVARYVSFLQKSQ
jgi:fatty acid CoA ligase FadD9